MEKQINNFLNFLQEEKKASENTLQSYKRDLIQFSNYITKKDINFLRIKNDQINEYIEYMEEIGKKSSTISRSIASIRAFYQYMQRCGKIKKDPTEGIQSPKIAKRVPTVLSAQEVELEYRFKRN